MYILFANDMSQMSWPSALAAIVGAVVFGWIVTTLIKN